VARLFFGKIGGGRDLVAAISFFPSRRSGLLRQENHAPRFCLRFAFGLPQRNHMRSMPERGVARAIECKCLTGLNNSPAPVWRPRSPWRSSN
jgi:hypothetical protein